MMNTGIAGKATNFVKSAIEEAASSNAAAQIAKARETGMRVVGDRVGGDSATLASLPAYALLGFGVLALAVVMDCIDHGYVLDADVEVDIPKKKAGGRLHLAPSS